jgi:Asp-tRNAAsn/Glu-tRNAGln amidotransferase A subunit and related amidases
MQMFGNRPPKWSAICGKDEFVGAGVAVSGMNAYYGTPRNPLDRGRIPGGSSSGSAVAVANDEADVAFGTDTAGSIRVPAACCGVVGLKTTFGLVDRRRISDCSEPARHHWTIGQRHRRHSPGHGVAASGILGALSTSGSRQTFSRAFESGAFI